MIEIGDTTLTADRRAEFIWFTVFMKNNIFIIWHA
jgi:hypothetical protein